MTGPGFAVLDFETTGLHPSRAHRAIELAIVHLGPDGEVQDRWETLFNPMRDLGPQSIHGISAGDLLDAPTFEEVAGDVLARLSGRVPVAHNAWFDAQFLLAELERAGIELWQPPEFICTMQLAAKHLPGSSRSLASCCDSFDIELADAHRAANDALAAAHLLSAFIRQDLGHQDWPARLLAAEQFAWPEARSTRAAKPRPAWAIERRADTFIGRITLKMPVFSGPDDHRSYITLLESALLDRRFSAHETEALVRVAQDLGIGRSTVEELHLDYFIAMTRTAWDDSILTDEEIVGLLAVADLLSLPNDAVERALSGPPPAREKTGENGLSFSLSPGDLVVLTGEMSRERTDIEDEIRTYGLTPANGVTKKVRLVIAADPDSLSGNARKARDYGIPVVDEPGGMTLVRGLGAAQ